MDDFLSDDDKALFREHVRSVKPLNAQIKRVNTDTPKPHVPIRPLSKLAVSSEVRGDTEHRTAVYTQVHEDSSTVSTKQFADTVEFPKRSIKRSSQTPTPEERKEYGLSDTIIEEVLSHTILSYCQTGLTPSRFKALKNAQIPWEARLDLHGLKVDKAREVLCQFIQNQVLKSKRCLLIIHGKGGHQNTPPVIKNLVNRWLPQLSDVLAFHSALPKDGGSGAVYVLLKRQR